MAKEQWHNWGRYVFLGIIIIFATGGWVIIVQNNTKDIEVLQKDTKQLGEDVHRIELAAVDIKSVAVKAAEAMVSIDTKLTSIRTEQTKQATIQAVNSEKLKQLTKD